MTIEEIEKAYSECLNGLHTKPSFMLTRFGAFFHNGKVMDFDEDGNYFEIPEVEQQKRHEQLEEFLKSNA